MIQQAAFLSWARQRFGEAEIRGNEVKLNSPWAEDRKFHLWCNPSKNAFHCWKTGKSGNLRELVMEIDGCSYEDASQILGGDNQLRELEAKLEAYFAPKNTAPQQTAQPSVSLPPATFHILDVSPHSPYRSRAEQYLRSRKLPVDDLCLCLDGRYQNRIIIPYFGRQRQLLYWNSRSLENKSPWRYLGPRDSAVGKSDVLFFPHGRWPEPEARLYLTEGEFDALSLAECGLQAAACGGKEFHHKQLRLLHQDQYQLLKTSKLCLALDADERGREALNKIGTELLREGLVQMTYVRPPVACKDWNQMLIEESSQALTEYVRAHERPFHFWELAQSF